MSVRPSNRGQAAGRNLSRKRREPRSIDELKLSTSDNIVVTDTVADVRHYLYKNVLFAMPLRLSGGTRLKVLQAISMPKKVVSTSGGCEGMDVSHWEHVLIFSEPRAFAHVRREANPSPCEKSQLRSDMSVAARHAPNQKFNACGNYPKVPTVCKDCKDAG